MSKSSQAVCFERTDNDFFNILPVDILKVILSFINGCEEDFMVRLTCKTFDAILDRNPHSTKNISMYYAQKGYLSCLQWLECRGYLLESYLTNYAALFNHKEVLIWLQSINHKFTVDTIANACLGGHLDLIIWLRENNCPWDDFSCCMAARGGNLLLLQWLKLHGCPWDVFTCVHAARYGHLELLQWARSQNCPWDSDVSLAAIEHLEIAKWLKENNCPWPTFFLERAAKGGHLDTLQWGYDKSRDSIAEICKSAVEGGQIKVLEWAVENGAILTGELHVIATNAHKLNVLKWLKEKGIENPKVHYCAKIAINGLDTKILKWLHLEEGLVLDSSLLDSLTEGPWAKMAKWLVRHGCKPDQRFVEEVMRCSNYKLLKWLHSTGCDWNNESLCYLAVELGDLEGLIWLREIGCPWVPGSLRLATELGFQDIVDYIVENDLEE